MFRCVVLAVLLAGAAWAQEADEPATIVAVKWAGQKLELVDKLDDPGPCPPQHGTPQLAPLFFEVTGEDGDVLYAGTIYDSRNSSVDWFGEDDQIRGSGVDESQRRHELRFPRFESARRFTAYRRVQSGDDEGERMVLLEVDL